MPTHQEEFLGACKILIVRTGHWPTNLSAGSSLVSREVPDSFGSLDFWYLALLDKIFIPFPLSSSE
jgi:hypothetical protein